VWRRAVTTKTKTSPAKKRPAAKKKTATAPKKASTKMDARAWKFCEEYLVDLNATRAYQAAYPQCKSAGAASVGGHDLLRKPNIIAYIDERLSSMKAVHVASANEVLMELTKTARGEVFEKVAINTGDGVTELVDRPVDGRVRLRAWELLGRRHGLFEDKVDVTSGGKPLGPTILLPEKAPHKWKDGA
jgi:phage terminase small subunit